MKNRNHPKKGARTVVDPIRSRKDINAFSKLLSDKPRDFLLFKMGVNNGLRTGDYISIREKKPDKENVLTDLVTRGDFTPGFLDTFLFEGRISDFNLE